MPADPEGDEMDKTLWQSFKEFMTTTPEQRQNKLVKKIGPINAIRKGLSAGSVSDKDMKLIKNAPGSGSVSDKEK